MRFLANENVPGEAIDALRAAGHDVAWIRTDAPGISDRTILARAVHEQRIVVTFDKDFGELAWRERLPAECGVVLFRIPMPADSNHGRIIAETLSNRDDWQGRFSVIEPDRIRMRPLPPVGKEP
jgi:predicted nuclease of predicted toxin-antitoxin system